jgi:type II secretion system protein L
LKTTLILQPEGDDAWRWRSPLDARAGGGDAQALAAAAADAELVLAVPAQRALLREVTVAAHERRLLRQTVPYSLEEELVDDVDGQHFAFGPLQGGRVPVAIVGRAWLASALERAAAAGLDIRRIVPEQLLLPWREGCWTLLAEPGRWVVRAGPWRGFALEPEAAALALQLLLDDAESVPRQLLVYSDEAPETLLPQLPELLRGVAELHAAGELPPPAAAPLIDLRQGAFARALPWRRWWRSWRWPLAAVAVAVVVQFAVAAVQHWQLSERNLELRRQIEQVYRSVEPQGAVVEPERQLRRKVQALQGQSAGALLPLLEQVGGALRSIDGIALQNLTYSERQGEVRLNLSAPSFADVEKLRQALAAKGLRAELVGSNADGDRTRAQMRIGERR